MFKLIRLLISLKEFIFVLFIFLLYYLIASLFSINHKSAFSTS